VSRESPIAPGWVNFTSATSPLHSNDYVPQIARPACLDSRDYDLPWDEVTAPATALAELIGWGSAHKPFIEYAK
jgi:hypothetical protein